MCRLITSFQGLLVVGEAKLEAGFCGPDISFFTLGGANLSFVDYGRFLARTWKRAVSWDTAIAIRRRLVLRPIIAEYSLVVHGNDLLDTRHATITQLNGVFVEDLVEPVLCAEVLVEQVEECSANISLHLGIEWGVVPDDIPHALFFCWLLFRVNYICSVPAILQCFFIPYFSFFKFFYVA